jgi:hypothetical protein
VEKAQGYDIAVVIELKGDPGLQLFILFQLGHEGVEVKVFQGAVEQTPVEVSSPS